MEIDDWMDGKPELREGGPPSADYLSRPPTFNMWGFRRLHFLDVFLVRFKQRRSGAAGDGTETGDGGTGS